MFLATYDRPRHLSRRRLGEGGSKAALYGSDANQSSNHGLVEGTICIIFPLADVLSQSMYMVADPAEACVY
jgi:hypothetical protein